MHQSVKWLIFGELPKFKDWTERFQKCPLYMSCSVLRNLFLSVVVFWSVTVQCKSIRRNIYIYDLYRDCCQIQFAFCSDKSNDAFSRIIYFNLSNLKVANVPYDYYIGFKYLNHIKFRWGGSEGIFCLSGGG